MADGSVPLVLSPEPFSREVAYLEQPAGRTIKAALLDAVKSGAIDADDLSRTVVYVDGQRLERDQTLDRVLVEGQIINVVVEPMGGGGRKDIGQILMTIAVIAVSMWIGGGGTALGTTLLARVAAAAVLTLGQAAVAAIFAPETENQAKVNERYALQTASNQYRPWAPMPLALGEVVVAPDFAAKTYTQSVGDDVWLHGILGLHYGPCTVADLKIGDTLASSMGPGDFRMVEHLTPGPREFTIYQNDPDQLDLQEELEATTGSATPIVRAGSAAGERFDFDFFLPGGLHFQKDDGRVLAASVTVYVRYRPVDEDGNPTGGGTWSTAPAVSRSSTTKEPMRFTHSVSLPMGRYEFEFVRSLKPDNNEKRRDRIALTAIRSVAFRKAVTDETLSIIEFAVRATALNQGTLAPITCRIIPVCETWNGTAWGSPAPTSNPAALMRWLMTGPAPALPLQPAQADARLRAWAELCDEYDWRAGIYLLEERRQDQVIALLEQAGRASLFWDGRQLAAVCWVEKPAPVQLFANSNLRDHRWTIVYPDPVHAFRVEFQNIEEGGDPDELYVYADGYAETAGPGVEAAVLVEALRLEGQKTPERAYRDGRWELGARLHRRRIDTWTLDAEHLVSGYGARVRLAWQRVDGGTSSRIRCRRWSGGLVSGVRLAHPVEMLPGESYAVDIRLASGVATSVPVINEADDAAVVTRELQFAVPRAPEFSPKRDDLIAFGVPTRISEDTEIIGVEPGEGLTAVLTGVRYVAPLLMAGETGPIPPLQTRLNRQRQASPPAPRFLGVQADPEGVRVSFDMPPWSGSPIVGFSARWRPTPAPGTETSWQGLPPVAAGDRMVMIPSPRALPVSADDFEGRTLIDVEIRAVTEAGQTSPEPMTLEAVNVRKDPFPPDNLQVAPATRTGPQGSSHGVLAVSVTALEAAVGVDLILEVQRTPTSGSPDPWESAGLILAAKNPVGDITGLRSGERYRVRGGWRSGDGWPSAWTTSGLHTVPAGSNVSDDTKNVGDVPAEDIAAQASQVPVLSQLLQDAQDAIAQHEATLNTATSGLVDRTQAIFNQLNTPTTGALARITATETAIYTPTTGLAARLTATEVAINTPTTGLLAVNAAQQQSIVNLQTGKAEASALAVVAARARQLSEQALPSDFSQDSAFWRVSWTDTPAIRADVYPPLDAYAGTTFSTTGDGRVLNVRTTDFRFGPLAWLPLKAGHKTRITLRARALTTSGAANLYLRGIALSADSQAAWGISDANMNINPVDGIKTLSVVVDHDYVIATFPSADYLRPEALINYPAGTQDIDILSFLTEPNVADELALEASVSSLQLAVTSLDGQKANASDLLVVKSRVDGVTGTTFARDFQFQGQGWRTAYEGQPGTGGPSVTPIQAVAPFSFVDVAGVGRVMQISAAVDLCPDAAAVLVAGRTLKVKARWRQISGPLGGVDLYTINLSQHWALLPGYTAASRVTPALNVWQEHEVVQGADVLISNAGAYWRSLFRTYGGGGVYQVQFIETGDGVADRLASLSGTVSQLSQTAADLALGKADASRVALIEARAGGSNLLTRSQFFGSDYAPGVIPGPWSAGGYLSGASTASVWPNNGDYSPPVNSERPLYAADLTGAGTNESAYYDFYSEQVPWDGVKRACVSAYTGAHRCSMRLIAACLNSAGAALLYPDEGFSSATSSNQAEKQGGPSLTDFKRLKLFFTPPAGTARIQLLLRKGPTYAGQPSSYAFWLRPMLSEATATQTEAPPWAPGSVEARVTAAETASATLEGRLESRALLQAVAGNQIAGMQVLAVSGPDAAYSAINFWATAVQISNNGTNAIAPFEVRGNVVRMREAVIDRVSVGTEILVGSRRLKLAVQPFPVSVTDGVPVSFGYDIGLTPEIVFLRDGPVSQPGSGESNNYYAESASGTGFTPRLKITTVALPSNQTAGPTGGTTDSVRTYYQLNGSGGAVNNTVNVRVTGVIQSVHENPGWTGNPLELQDGNVSQSGYMVIGLWKYHATLGWQDAGQIFVSPPYRGNQDAPGTYNDAFDITQAVTVDPSINYVGAGLDYEEYAGSYLTDVRLSYQIATSSGTRSATPNGELTTAMIYPKNGVS